MPIITPASDASGNFEQLFSQAGMAQALYPPAVFPSLTSPTTGTIGAGGNWASGLMFGGGFRYITVALTSSQAGSLVIQEYVDLAGTIPRVVSTTPIVAATPLIVDIADLKPFATVTIQINNSSGSPATVTAFQVLMSAG